MTRKQKQEKEETRDSLQSLRESLQKKFGNEIIRRYLEPEKVKTIPTGIIRLDKALGGGIGLGRMTELLGNPSAGKTTIILSIMKQAQKMFPDKYVVYIDAEHALDTTWAAKIGIDLSKFEHIQPVLAEDALEILEEYLKTGEASVIAIDSIPALLSKVELEGEIGEANIAIQARLIAQELRRLCSLLFTQKNSSIIFVNQKRAQLQTRGGFQGYEPSKATGGKALPFYVTTRLDISRIGKGSSDYSQEVQVHVLKHKIGYGPGAKVTFEIDNKTGVDYAQELLSIAEEKGLVIKAGSWISIDGTKVQGEEAAKKIVREKFADKWTKEFVEEV